MGCTHYPILEDVIKKIMGSGVFIVNAGRETAKEVKRTLEKRKILNDKGKGGCEYYVTDAPEAFRAIGSHITFKEPSTKIEVPEKPRLQRLPSFFMIVDVALPIPVAKTFSYTVPDGWKPFVEPFVRSQSAPFTTNFVSGLSQVSAKAAIRGSEIRDLIDFSPSSIIL